MRETNEKIKRRKVKELGEWPRTNRHLPVAEQHAQLSAKIRGHLQHYGVTFWVKWVKALYSSGQMGY